jgi:hypothetical protein
MPASYSVRTGTSGSYRKLPNTLVRAVFDFTGIFRRKTDLLRFVATTIQVSAP